MELLKLTGHYRSDSHPPESRGPLAQYQDEPGDEHERCEADENEEKQRLFGHRLRRKRAVKRLIPGGEVRETVSENTEQNRDRDQGQGFRPRGSRVVVVLYIVVVAITGLTGYLLGSIGPEGLRSVTLLGVVTLPPTPIGLAIYGAVTLGVGLGVALGLVAFVSRRYA